MKNFIKKIVPIEIIDVIIKIITFFAVIFYKIKHKNLIIRSGTTDGNVFWSTFILEECKIPIKINPKLIIDAGAYIGLTSLYFSSSYPLAKIIAIEPEKANFKILENNTKNLPFVTRINAGLWQKDAFLRIIDRRMGNWGFAMEEVSSLDNHDVRAITVDTILTNSGFSVIDILKIDIEGSEKDLFSDNYETWMKKTNVIIIELHDRIKNGCTKAFYSSINKEEWNEHRKGEKVILVRKNLLVNQFIK